MIDTDNRSLNESILLDNLGKIAFTLDKAYLSNLEQYPVLPFDEYNENEKNEETEPQKESGVITICGNIRCLKINKWVLDKDEKPSDCFKNILNSFSDGDHTLALLIKRTSSETEMYFVVKNSGIGRNEESSNNLKLLKQSIKGNFQGTEVEEVSVIKIKKEDDFSPLAKLLDLSKYTSVASMTNSPSEFSEDYLTQGLDKVLNGVVPEEGKEYMIMFVAESLSSSDAANVLSGYEDLASAITPFVQHQFQIGENQLDTNSETVSATNSSVINKTISKTHSINGHIGINISKVAHLGAGYGYSWGDLEGESTGKTSSTGTSRSISIGKSNNTTLSYKSYMVSNITEKLEKTMKRIIKGQGTGIWKYAAYVLSDESSNSINIANYLRAVTQGKESYTEQAFVQEWSKNSDVDKYNDVINYISKITHPIFVCDNRGEDNPILVTPTSYISTDELSHVISFPRKSLQGLPVLHGVQFGREPHTIAEKNIDNDDKLIIGKGYHMFEEISTTNICLLKNELTKHTFITGSTGSGKSNLIYNLLDKIHSDKNKHFLVIEPAKGEYKNVLGGFNDVSVYGTNPMYTELLHINPFSFPEHINVLEHIDRLVEIFNACWPMYAAMPAVLKDSIERVYKDKGWVFSNPAYYSDAFPTFADLIKVLPDIMSESLYSSDTKSDYSGALITRVKSLTNGINGEIFCSTMEISNEALFDRNVIVDISRVGSVETKSLIMGILIMKLQEYRMQPDKMNESLQHITVLEEAHNLLRRTSFAQAQESSNLQGKSVEMLTNAIAEMRTYGEGFIIADQAPDMLDEAVIRNTNTKIIFRLPDEHDCELVGKSIALTNVQIKELAKLPAFVAVIHQNDWIEAVLCKSEKYDKERKYTFSKKESNISAYHLMLNIYGIPEKKALDEKEKVEVLDWINRLENGDNTKRILRKGLVDEALTEEEKLIVAYNVFGGQRTAMLLRNAENNEVGLSRVRRSIGSVFSLDSDNKLIDTVQQYICTAINREETCADIARRYQYFGMSGGII